MKAIVSYKYGPPDALRMESVPIPILDDDKVLVKVRAVSLNSWDWDTLTGKPYEYRLFSGLLKPKSRRIRGCDIAGRVEVVGKDVKHLKVGDEVFGDLSVNGWGAYAEYASAPENAMTLKPEVMSFNAASCLSHGGNLAVQGLVDYGKIQAGQKVLINGGGGSTGTLAIQIAKQFDVEITAVDCAEKLDLMRSLGADHVIDYTKEDFTNNGRQYDLIFDVKTNRSIFDYKRALRPNGTYVSVGGKTTRVLQLVLFRKLIKDCEMRMVGYKANKDTSYLVELFEAGKIKPVIDKVFPLAKTADAFNYFGQGRFKGKIVVTLGSEAEAE
jgi:NADPH:quinone reductase-like Zn-dependent oxidoreductase